MRKLAGRLYAWLFGWEIVGEAPKAKKYILIAAPHTSNWDLPIMLAASFVLGMRVSWIGKHTLFRFPFGRLMRALGGVSVDRRSRHNTVQQIINEFNRRESLCLVVPVEGTRSRTEYWKSGFYHMALGANVPLVLAVLDYKHKQAGIVGEYKLTGNVDQDMAVLRKHYEKITAKYPDCYGPIRLRPAEKNPPLHATADRTTSQ